MVTAREAPLRVLILDDDLEQRRLLAEHLTRDARFAVVAACSLKDGLPLGPSQPDLILVDPTRAGRLDPQYLRLLFAQVLRARVVVRTAAFEAAALLDLLALGVSGVFVRLPEPTAALCDGLALIASADAVVLARAMVEALRRELIATRLLGPQLPLPTLDPQELAVLRGHVAGQGRKQIAAATGLSASSVQRLSDRLKRRLGAHSLAQLAAEAVRRGLV